MNNDTLTKMAIMQSLAYPMRYESEFAGSSIAAKNRCNKKRRIASKAKIKRKIQKQSRKRNR